MQRSAKRRALAALMAAGALLVAGSADAAGRWEYRIEAVDTPGTIDAAATGATVDTTAREIRLPRSAATTVAFWPDGGPDFIVAAPGKVLHFSWDGSRMVENSVASVPLDTNPLAVAAPDPYPDVVVAAPDGIRHYSFDGAAMVRNPALEVAGLTGIVSLGVRDSTDVAALAAGVVRYYQSSGTGMLENPWLEPSAPLTNPVAIALRPDNFDLAVLEPGQVRFFGFDGAGMTEIPQLAITGLAGAKAIAYGDNGDVAVVAGNEVRHYGFDGAGMTYVPALSVGPGVLSAPTSVALKPGSFDRVIVDGDNVRYFAWDGTQLVEDPSRSVTVAGLSSLGAYLAMASAQSLARDPLIPASRVRVRAQHVLEPNTAVTWFVTANGGATWTARWRARADGSGVAVCETTEDGGTTWNVIGDLATCWNDPEGKLWAQVPAGRDVRWKAQLTTTAGDRTPRVKATVPGDVAVVWEADARPNPPVLQPGPPPGVCYDTSTPRFGWTFSDPDPGDTQGGFQIQIKRADDPDWDTAPLVYDSGWVASSDPYFMVPTSTQPDVGGPLWRSGTYRFDLRIRVRDSYGQESDWTAPQPFCVLALERLRIVEIVSPPPGQTAPDRADPTTHILVWPGQPVSTLPKAKAGARVRVRLDGIGPIQTLSPVFRYQNATGTTRTASVGPGTPTWLRPPGSETNQWDIDVWTEAPLDVVPSGTVVKGDITGDAGAVGAARWVPAAPYDSGVYVTEGSVYSDWLVVLEGSTP